MTHGDKQWRRFLYLTFVGITLASSSISSFAALQQAEQISDNAMQEIKALEQEKAARSPLHRKLETELVLKLKLDRHQLPGLPRLQSRVKMETDGRVLVDINADVTKELIEQIELSGGKIVSSVPGFHSIRALVPFDQLESLAVSTDVKFIRRAVHARTSGVSIISQGDLTHGADLARSTFGVSGAGIKIGVLSDSVDFLANSQAAGELPTNVTVLPGQEGSGTGEGTAMLEIIHDLAPDAQLYFATAFNSEAGFAQNILALRSSGCDIILDDVFYSDEPPFQDGIIAQAVNSVVADGALFFSSAGNDGNLNDTTSTTWEGDFLDGGTFTLTETNDGANYDAAIHSFGPLNFNRVLTADNSDTENDLTLFWSDPLGASTNDYDLFVLDPSGTSVTDYSGDWQDGSQDAFESCYCEANSRVVITKFAGEDRFLHLQVLANGTARLNISTDGNATGHSTATNAFSVAAVNAASNYPNPFSAPNPTGPYPGLFTGGNTNPVEWFSSDGPRRVFFNADGSPITPGNFSSTGGAIRQKPDITASDGVSTSVPGFESFFGTSAAAPHAAGIAALIKCYNPGLSRDQIRAALVSTALDINDPGVDRDSGAGIVMAVPALRYIVSLIPVIESIALTNNSATITWSALTNQLYEVRYRTNLLQTDWINLTGPITATNATMSTVDEILSDPQRFYRVFVSP